MTQEEKQLLLQDICARLPYGIKCTTKLTVYNDVYVVQGVYEDNVFIDCPIYEEGDDEWMIESIIPFLRPMSSMTGKEWMEYCDACVEDEKSWVWAGKEYKFTPVTHREEFLNSHHFDYRGLIERGLAIEAPKDMYDI